MATGFARQDALHEVTQEGISNLVALLEKDIRTLKKDHGGRLTKVEKHLGFA